MAKKKQKKKYTPQTTSQLMKGLIITWSDENPLDDESCVIPGVVTHRNPYKRLFAPRLFSENKDRITVRIPYMWLITITVVFKYETADQTEERELRAFATIGDLESLCEKEIEDAMRHGSMDSYVNTLFRIECIGLNDTLAEAC